MTSSQPDARSALRRRAPWIVGGAVVVIGVIVAAVLILGGGGKSTPPRFVAAPTGSSLSSGADQLVSLLNHGAGQTYTATYQAAPSPTPTTTAPGPSITLKVWQAPPNTREDVIETSGKQTEHFAAISNKTSAQLCTQSGSGPWSCQAVALTQANAIGLDGAVAAFISELGGRPVSSRSATVAGMAARCFTSSGPDAGTLCTTTSGIPLSISDQKVSYQAVTVTSTAAAGAFTTPPTQS